MRTYHENINADFTCKHCGSFVTSEPLISGVVNRNHCPTCLYSRHVDLFKPGDRLCACKGVMAPVGLTLKQSRDKYANDCRGELMLIHRCLDCGALSINRIAADDDPINLMTVFIGSLDIKADLYQHFEKKGILLLGENERPLVESRLYGMPA